MLLLIGLTACKPNPLYGSWVEPSSGVTLEINKNGSLAMGLNGVSATFTYTVEDPDILIIKASTNAALPDQKMTYKADEETLTFIFEGTSTTFKRKK